MAADAEMEEEMDEEYLESGEEEDEESSGYSLETTIAAFQDYYNFLTKMYLNPSSIAWPPKDGWPNITPESMAPLEKSPAVIDLLRNLPYIKQDPTDSSTAPAKWYGPTGTPPSANSSKAAHPSKVSESSQRKTQILYLNTSSASQWVATTAGTSI